jgi:hypothetical protein
VVFESQKAKKKPFFRGRRVWIRFPFPSIPPAEVLANLNNVGGMGDEHEAMVVPGSQVVKDGSFR